MSTYKQCIINNTSWDHYGGQKDQQRRFLLFTHTETLSVGVPLTTTYKINHLHLEKDQQLTSSLDHDSYVDFFILPRLTLKTQKWICLSTESK